MVRDFLYDHLNLLLGAEGEALQDVAAPGAAGRLEARFGPVDAGDVAAVMPAVGIFFAADYNARVEEGAAEGPEDRGQAAGLRWVSISLMLLEHVRV